MSRLRVSRCWESVCVRTTIDNLSQAPLPCILHWNQNHFVVLYKVRKGKRFYVADPGKGLVSYSRDEFRNHWVSTRSGGEDKGIAMLLEPTPARFMRFVLMESPIPIWSPAGGPDR